ncbi:hypothetical protein TNCV_2887221 [Trichonephila clavipes]|nr:hypothetical protein TNCV_2887221 [Trichonephila clavipes]
MLPDLQAAVRRLRDLKAGHSGRTKLSNAPGEKKMERGEEDQISSSITHIKNLTLLTSSKYNELNGQVMVSEWPKTARLKKSSMPNQ